MYKFYFGDNAPDDRREALAQMIIGLGGFGAVCLVAAAVLVAWCQGAL